MVTITFSFFLVKDTLVCLPLDSWLIELMLLVSVQKCWFIPVGMWRASVLLTAVVYRSYMEPRSELWAFP